MKTLIINTPRSGGNALAIRLASERPSFYVLNPFDGTNRTSIPPDVEKIVVKTPVLHPSDDEFEAIYPVNIQLRVKFITELAKNYEEIILLDRRDTIGQIESYAHTHYRCRTLRVDDLDPTIYAYSRRNVSDDTFETAKREIGDAKITLTKLSYKLKVPVTYYEDIFDEHSNDRYRKASLI